MAAEVRGLQRLLLDLLQLLPGEVTGAEGLRGLVPGDELLQAGGLEVEVGKLAQPDALVPLLHILPPDGQNLVHSKDPLLLLLAAQH